MHTALSYLGTLPNHTVVYNGHEYTGGNVAFANSVDGANPAVQKLVKLTKENTQTTGLTTIQDEKEWNPFMRLDAPAIKCVFTLTLILNLCSRILMGCVYRKATGKTDTIEIMHTLREMKNSYRG